MAANESQPGAHPYLALFLGCLGMLLFPLLLLAGSGYLMYQYFSPDSVAPAATAPADEQEVVVDNFSKDQGRAIQESFRCLAALDPSVQKQGWTMLYPYHQKNPPAVRERLIEELRKSNSRVFIYQATWGLCAYYEEPGCAAVVNFAVRRQGDYVALQAVADALRALRPSDSGDAMRERVREALEKVKSQYADLFGQR